jgi:hypothetical protein
VSAVDFDQQANAMISCGSYWRSSTSSHGARNHRCREDSCIAFVELLEKAIIEIQCVRWSSPRGVGDVAAVTAADHQPFARSNASTNALLGVQDHITTSITRLIHNKQSRVGVEVTKWIVTQTVRCMRRVEQNCCISDDIRIVIVYIKLAINDR